MFYWPAASPALTSQEIHAAFFQQGWNQNSKLTLQPWHHPPSQDPASSTSCSWSHYTLEYATCRCKQKSPPAAPYMHRRHVQSSTCCVPQQQVWECWDYNNMAVNHTVWACVWGRLSSVNRLWAPVDTSTTGASNVDYCALSASEGSKQGAAGKTSLASVCLNSKESLDPGL